MRYVLTLIFITYSFVVLPIAQATANDGIELVIVRSNHTLHVKQDGHTLRSYRVALGSGGKKNKLNEGDRKTPTGSYHIAKVRESDRFHMFMQLDYPNVKDAIRALKDKRITRKQYQDILDAHIFGHMPPQNTALGGAIGIHGIGEETEEKLEIHQIADWTKGCIALRNDEVDELQRFIQIGTKVTIID